MRLERMADHSTTLLGGRYRLGERIGEGGFGAVYGGIDTELQRPVAIKIFDPQKEARSASQAELLRERFRREAVATASIRHPNVVTVYDIGVNGGDVYIVMELLEGRPLNEELERWPTGIAAERALPLFVDALRGLEIGHQAGVVHKDLKPANLFLCDPGTAHERLRIIDFGVARVVHEQKLTATGKIVGTPRYLAPEYIERHEVSPALDVYQMGLILVETLSSLPCVPKRLDLVSCCQRHLDGALKIPPGLREGKIGEVIARATAVRLADRFESAAEFADALATVAPESVQPEAPGADRATPRLGIVPLRRETQPLNGAANLEAQEQEREREPVRRSTRTAPTKRLGSAAEISAQMASLKDNSETAVITVTETLPDPHQRTRKVIYGLVLVAALTTIATLYFLSAADADPAPPPTDQPPAASTARPVEATPSIAAEPVELQHGAADTQEIPAAAQPVEPEAEEPRAVAEPAPRAKAATKPRRDDQSSKPAKEPEVAQPPPKAETEANDSMLILD